MTTTTATDPKLVEETWPPCGTYSGTWGGYRVRFNALGHWYDAATHIRIRTPSAPCRVTVTEAEIRVETVDKS